MTRVRLAEILRLRGQQADHEVDPAKVAIAQPDQPRPHLRLDLNVVSARHAFDAI
jgi:hypothetical protein